MINVQKFESDNTLVEWADELARYDDMREPLAIAQRRRPLAGIKWEITGRHATESATEQRSVIAAALCTALGSVDPRLPAHITMTLFDTYWQAPTVVNRRRGGDRLIERSAQNYGVHGIVADSTCVSSADGVKWCVALEIGAAALPGALAAVEHEHAALLHSTQGADAEILLRDLFTDENGALGTRPLWPLWAVRRAERDDAVILAQELNDHTGRLAFLLGMPEAHWDAHCR